MRKQRTFANLTEEEINQISEWLRGGKYDEVRDRIAKPRPEGFGLELKSTRPLETLWKNLSTVDKINTKLEKGEKLTVSDLNAIRAGDREDVPDKVHDAIMDTTLELATSGDNRPSDLLKLQQLADFPARAEYRAHKVDMDLHRKEMSEKRFALSEKAHQLRERIVEVRLTQASKSHSQPGAPQHAFQSSTQNSSLKEDALGRKEDHLGYLARTREDIRRRARAKYGPHIHPYLADPAATAPLPHSSTGSEETANIPSPAEKPLGEPLIPNTEVPIEMTHSIETNPATSATQPGNTLAPSSPSEDLQSNREAISNSAQTQSRQASAAHFGTPSASANVPLINTGLQSGELNTSATQTASAVSPIPLPSEATNPVPTAGSSLPPTAPSTNDSAKPTFSPLPPVDSSRNPKPSPSSVASPNVDAAKNSALPTLNSKLKNHAIKRWRAHIPRPPGAPEPDGSWRDECPCGNPAPCAEHPELKGRVRPYKPQHPDYQAGLKEFGVPYYKPTAEEIGCTQQALDRSCDLFADNPKIKDAPPPHITTVRVLR